MKPSDARLIAVAGVGAVGGGVIAYWAIDHLFGQGLTPDERKQIGGFGIALGTMALASQLPWGEWLTIEGVGGKVDKLIAGG